MNWREEANRIAAKLEGYRQDKEGWKEAKSSKDVVVYWKPSPDFDGCLYKTEAMIQAPPETVFKYVDPKPDGKRIQWDKAIKDLQIVQSMEKDLFVLQTITHSAVGGLISPRDFVDLIHLVDCDEFIATNAKNVEHNGCPPHSKRVRGKNYPCGIFCMKLTGEPNKTKVVNFIQTDLGGMLPKALVESALPSNQCDFFASLKKMLKDDGVWVD